MNKQLLTALMVTVLWTMSAAVKAEVAPPPPKPECKDIVYRKWNDLLFVDNGNEEFTAYQWYENGNILIDETRQYLFRTGGLPNEYFCRLTTTDGSTIYTCAMTFDEAIPSRTVTSEGGETTSVKMYDPVGRIVSGKLSNGIYIILEEVGGEKIVRKVAVFE